MTELLVALERTDDSGETTEWTEPLPTPFTDGATDTATVFVVDDDDEGDDDAD